MVRGTHWEHQPRWPRGTPSPRKGPGAGRWRDDHKPNLPRRSWAEVVSDVFHGDLPGHHRRAEAELSFARQEHEARVREIRPRYGLHPDVQPGEHPDELGQRIRMASTTGTHMQAGETNEAYTARLRGAVQNSGYWAGVEHLPGDQYVAPTVMGSDGRPRRAAGQGRGLAGGRIQSVPPPADWADQIASRPSRSRDAAGYPDVPPGVDATEDEWIHMSYAERNRRIHDALRGSGEVGMRELQHPGPANDGSYVHPGATHSQTEWENAVRAELTRLGYNPDAVEAEVDGFGQDYADAHDDPEGYAQGIIGDLRVPDAAGLGAGDRSDYNDSILEEAIQTHEANVEDGEVDEELAAQIAIVRRMKVRKDPREWDAAVDHLREMLTISYLDNEDLPVPPARSGGGGMAELQHPGPQASLPGPGDVGYPTPQSVRAALRERVAQDPRIGSRVSEQDLANLTDEMIAEHIAQAEDDVATNPQMLDDHGDGPMTFHEWTVDSLAEQLRRFGPEELWPHLGWWRHTQTEWETSVRQELRRRGYDPAEVEAAAGGFGQDHAEYGGGSVDDYIQTVLADFTDTEKDNMRLDQGDFRDTPAMQANAAEFISRLRSRMDAHPVGHPNRARIARTHLQTASHGELRSLSRHLSQHGSGTTDEEIQAEIDRLLGR